MKYTCKQCGKEYELTQSEIEFYESKNLSLPKRCKECRVENKQQKKRKHHGQGKKQTQGRKPVQDGQKMQGRQPVQVGQKMQGRQSVQDGQKMQDRQQIQSKQLNQQTQIQMDLAQSVPMNSNPASKSNSGMLKYLAIGVLCILVLVGIFLLGS